MEIMTFIGLLMAQANGYKVPTAVWIVLFVWMAVHLAVAWFRLDE